MKKISTRIKPEHAAQLGLTINQGGCYRITQEQYKDLQGIRTNNVFEMHCDEQGINKDDVSLYWDKTKNFSVLVRPNASKDDLTPEYIKEVISGIKFDKQPIINPNRYSDEILRIIITDIHVGMETDATGYGLYSEVWMKKYYLLDLILY